MHSPSKTERLWFSQLLESQTLPSPEDTPLVHFDVALKKRIHELLTRSEVLDNFLQLKFPNLLRVRTSTISPCERTITFLCSIVLKEVSPCSLHSIFCFIQLRLASFFLNVVRFYNYFIKRESGISYLVSSHCELKDALG